MIGDTYEKHRELDCEPFLETQLELIKRIIATERRISKLRKGKPIDLEKIAETKERRVLLKFIGTTIAWILLEFDRPYIRNFAKGGGPGFISGKKGLKLEILALKAAFELKNHCAILHDITNCLRVGDLSVNGPRGILTLELKLSKRRKMSIREIRQRRKGEIVREFYERGISTKILPGYKSVRYTSKIRDKHNWNEMSTVIKEALENGTGNRIVEDCLIYSAFKNRISGYKLDSCLRQFKNPYFRFGCHDRQFFELPHIMPFTCFEIPILYKEKLLFGEVNFCVLLDINSLRRIMEQNGFDCRILKGSGKGILEVSNSQGKFKPMVIGHCLIDRLVYECLSIETLIDYTKEIYKAGPEYMERYWTNHSTSTSS